jgi:hypothetical protein
MKIVARHKEWKDLKPAIQAFEKRIRSESKQTTEYTRNVPKE